MFQQSPLEVYQLRFVLKEISPMIWRRLLVRNDSSIADLHHCLQIAMGWENEYLHQFTIQGKAYGIAYSGGIGFSDNARKVYLKDLGFRQNEKFTYEYNFFDHWIFEFRFEKQLPINPKKTYPFCVGGGRAAPPEDCGGPWAFMELEDRYSPWDIERKFMKLLKKHLATKKEGEKEEEEVEEDYDDDLYEEEDEEETLQNLAYWAHRHRFNRRKVNRQLQEHFNEKEAEGDKKN